MWLSGALAVWLKVAEIRCSSLLTVTLTTPLTADLSPNAVSDMAG